MIRSLRSLVRYRLEHSKRNPISTCNHYYLSVRLSAKSPRSDAKWFVYIFNLQQLPQSKGPDVLDWQNLFRPSKNLDKICPCQIFNLWSVGALNHGTIFVYHKCQSAWLLSIWLHVVMKLLLVLLLGWLGGHTYVQIEQEMQLER